MRRQRKNGFTVTELIVCCLCVSSLLAVGLPALTQNQERAQTTSCANRIREIALGAHAYHDANKRLPPATLGAGSGVTSEQWLDANDEKHWKNFQNTSSLALIMPFVELNSKYQQVDPAAFNLHRDLRETTNQTGTRLYAWQGDIPGAVETATTLEDKFACPADTINALDLQVAIASQPVYDKADTDRDISLQFWETAADRANLGRTSYTGCGGALGGFTGPERAQWKGCMTSRERVTLETISDGTSRTAMYGETLGGIKDSERTAVYSWFWAGFCRGRGDVPSLEPRHPDNDQIRMLGDSRWSSLAGFGSMHSGGVNVAFADGSVRTISRDIDWMTWYEVCGARDGGVPVDFGGGRGRREPEFTPVTEWPRRESTEPPPAVEEYLTSGRLDDGEQALQVRLQEQPDDDQARFGLGVLQFFQTVEHLAQSLHRHGAGGNSDSGLMRSIPFIRLPVPPNPDPDPIDLEGMRQILQTVIDDLEKVHQTLAGVQSDDVKLPLHISQIHLDLDGDGRCSDGEGLEPILQLFMGGGRPVDAVEGRGDPQPGPVVAFDRADVYWLQGYCHLLRAMAETMLAHDMEPVWNVFGHRLFARAVVPHEFLANDRVSEQDFIEIGLILDAVAAIHNLNLPVGDPERLLRALDHLREVVRQSRLSWAAIMAETDDDFEWIPAPGQSSAFPNARVTEEMVDTWRDFLDELESLLNGDKLAPFWRGDDPEVGVNLNRVFTEPRPFDLVLWIHGSAAAPYLEKGDVTSAETWMRFQDVFRGNFIGFAIWFN